MGFDDFFVHEKKDELLGFVTLNHARMTDITLEQAKETVNRYAREPWRARVAYDFMSWLGVVTYECETNAKVLNIGVKAANYLPHRSIQMPMSVLVHSLLHEQRFRVNGRMPPEFCDFEIWHGLQLEQFVRMYGEAHVQLRPGPADYLRIARVPFAIVKPDV